MLGRALLTLAGTTLLGIVVGAQIGRLIGTFAPVMYMTEFYGAHTRPQAANVGTGYGIINGSILGVVIGGLALLYDLGHRFLGARGSDGSRAGRDGDSQ